MPRIDYDVKLDFKDVLLRPKRSTLKSRSDVDLQRTYNFRNSLNAYHGVPIIAANMDTVGTFEMAIALAKTENSLDAGRVSNVNVLSCKYGLFTCIHKHYTINDWKKFASQHPDVLKTVAVSSGTAEGDVDKMVEILSLLPDVGFICLDVANGYSEHFVELVRKVRKLFPKKTIMAGNVVTGEMVEELILSGADIVKVGIGPGSVCTTRKKTGVGYPQLSAVIECADAAHGLNGHIISDGGCTCAGDVAKAFGAGADFVMIGGMFAGHDQSGGEIIERDGKMLKLFYGMASSTAMHKHHGKVADYRASEGKTVEIPYRGDVEETVQDILGGLRSACTYTGAGQLKELPKRTTFIRVTQQTNETFAGFQPEKSLHLASMEVNVESQSESEARSANERTVKSDSVSTNNIQKPNKKLIRVLTVIGYVISVSLAGVMLSLYYVFLWKPTVNTVRYDNRLPLAEPLVWTVEPSLPATVPAPVLQIPPQSAAGVVEGDVNLVTKEPDVDGNSEDMITSSQELLENPGRPDRDPVDA
ncbi:unnamed protein product [Notodromas monacha]|uniref:GMP reductase n=1 Tax=Notodromas monacha TaxID=399045 RepID=A0A7R9BHC8_9CRUS|nr:unnamed protein product [Notodromas monacha]CAG0913931.1 unnamed protein product [Notodromas monacha]